MPDLNKKRSLCFIVCAFLLSIAAAWTAEAETTAVSGILDLSGHDLYEDGKIRLDGEWQFFLDGAISPESFSGGKPPQPEGYYPVPGYWTAYPDLSLPSNGEATYRLLIHAREKGRLLSLKTPEIFTEYQLFINGECMDRHGKFADGKIRFLFPRVFTFENDRDTIEILLNIANHSHGNAGVGQSFFLGSPEEIQGDYIRSIVIEIILVAVCLFAGIYHIILFLLRRNETELLFFGLFCIALPLRAAFTGTTFIMQLIPTLPFETGSRIATMAIPLCVLAFMNYARSFFQPNYPGRLHQVLSLLHIVYLISTLIFPTMVYSTLFTPYLAVVLASCLLIIGTNAYAVMQQTRYAAIFLSGFLFLCIGVLNDTLHYLQVINTGYFLSVWFAFFIFAQSLMLAIKFANEHKMVEELSKRLQASDRMKDEFLANTSHELKTPLNGIIGISDSLIDGIAGTLPRLAVGNLNLISSSARRLASLINDILDLSRLKNDDISLSITDIDLRQITEVVLTVVKATIPHSRLELINDVSARFPTVKGDENRIQQILFNLIGNAVKFTEKGFVKVSAKDRGEYIAISVEDTGPGIPENQHEKIFHPFEQVDGTATRDHGGTGLGLSITRNLVELQGGRIHVRSGIDIGSVFSFTLPKGSAVELQQASTPEYLGETRNIEKDDPAVSSIYTPEQSGGTKEIILIVDDDTTNIHVLQNYLYLEGYRFRSATNGIQALEMLEEETFDLMLLDIMMPRMSGYEVLTHIRKKHTTYELPVLMLTAGHQNLDIATALQSGANDYLTKPVDRQELTARIKTQLSLSRAVATAIKNAELANTDALTGLYNRRFMTHSGNREFTRALKRNRPLSLMMLDIDRFKTINDTYGHAEGDKVLKNLAEIITKNIRGIDVAARYGGEEFVIILPGTASEGAAQAAEKIRHMVENTTVRILQDQEIQYTVSMGVASFQDAGSTFDDLIQTADNMLYQSKNNGRNQVTVST